MTLEAVLIIAVGVALDAPSEPILPPAISTDIPQFALERPESQAVAIENLSTLWRNAVRGAVDT